MPIIDRSKLVRVLCLRPQSLKQMMLLKGFVFILILSFLDFISCDPEELNYENSTVTNDTANDTKKSTVTSTNALQNSTTNRVKLKYGRSATEHFPVTKDGYILKIFRLYSKFPEKCPVLLVHGLFQSSDRFLDQNNSQSLAFKLQDLGYDVWLFNARGNKYSRGHVKLSPETNKTEFFDYSFEQIGCFDLSATVDYILKLTKFKKIHYIGHSFGATFFLVLNSLIPRYNKKFDKAFLMAPIAYHTSFPNENLLREFKDPSELHKELLKVGTTEIFPYNTTHEKEFIPNNCLGGKQWVKICKALKIQTIMGLNSDNNTIFDTRGGSIKTLIHWAQNVKSKQFRRWDFGEIGNDREYGAGKDPPEFPLNAITVMTKIIYVPGDEMVNDTDIAELAMQMKNATTRKVKSENFKHDDFVAGKFVMRDVYNRMIRDLSKDPKNFVKRKMTTVQKMNIEVVPEFPWVSVISLVMTFIFLIIQIVSCCRNKETKCTDSK